MANRLPLVRNNGQPAQIPTGDALLLRGPLSQAPRVTRAAAANMALQTITSDTVAVTGTTTITSLGSGTDGLRRVLQFSAALTLTNNASIVLPGGASILTAANDVAEFINQGGASVWRCIRYTRADGTALVGSPDPTKLPLAGGQMTGPINEAYGSANVSDTIMQFNGGNAAFVYAGVGDQITGLSDSTVTTLGAVRRIVFVAPGIVLVNGGNFILPSAANIITQNGDAMIVQADGPTAWRCISYQRADGTALVSSGSGSATTYTFTQSSALAVWTIPHNLNRFPSVTVVDTLGNVIVPDISYVDSNTVQVTHGAAYAGKAYLN